MIKTIYFVFFICAFALGLWACTGKEQEKFKSLSTAHFEQLIKDNKIQLVDVRTVAEYSEGHIPGSLNMSFRIFGRTYSGQPEHQCYGRELCRSR